MKAQQEIGSILRQWLPIAQWLPEYRLAWLRNDIMAGLTVWAVMVPTALAYTGIAGVHPIVGLYTVPLALIGYAIFGTSRSLVVGPDSATALISAHTIAVVAVAGTSKYLALSSGLALMVGLLFLAFGALRLGWMAHFISRPVMKGFIQGLALVTMMTQLPKLFGVAGEHGEFIARLWQLIKELPNTNPATLAVGLGGLISLYGLQRFFPKMPGALITVVLSTAVVALFDLQQYGVAVVGSIDRGFPDFGVPDVTFSEFRTLMHGALAIVLLNYVQSIGVAKTAAELRHESVNPNQEMIGLGVANLGSACSSGFVVAGSLSQSAVSMTAGGKTQMAALFHAVLMLITLLFLMPWFESLPMAVLAAIVVKAMVGVLETSYFKRLYQQNKAEAGVAAVAYAGVLLIGVLPGVGVGVVLSLILVIYRSSHPNVSVLGKVGDHEIYHDISRHPEARTIPGLLILRFGGPFYFASSDFFAETVKRKVAASQIPVRGVLVDCESVNFVDPTAVDMLMKLHEELSARNVRLAFACLHHTVKGQFRVTGFAEMIGSEHLYETISDGVERIQLEWD